MQASEWLTAVSLALATLALVLTLRERAAGPRTALFERRLDAVVELSEALWAAHQETDRRIGQSQADPPALSPPNAGSQAVDDTSQRLLQLTGKWRAVLDARTTKAVQDYVEASGLAIGDPATKTAPRLAFEAAAAALRTAVSVDPLGDALRQVTGQAGRERDAAIIEDYRKADDFLRKR